MHGVTEYQNGYNPLLIATSNGYFPMVELLVESGADIEATNNVSNVA